MKRYIYIHICCINNWKDIVGDLVNKIKDSGLYEKIDEIRCCFLGDFTTDFFGGDPKIHVRGNSSDLSLHEKFTIDLLREDAINEPHFQVLYMHSKGVSNQYVTNLKKAGYIKDWVNYMCYFLIYKHELAFKTLEGADTVGVNLQLIPPIKPHYSGNFWWANSDYIKKLEVCPGTYYNAPESWLTESFSGIYECLWDSEINHYEASYPATEYS